MRVMMMTGAWPPEACGVGDYTAKLADHLDGGAEVIRYRPGGSYTRRPVSTVLSDIVRAAPDVIHIQYPAAGYLRSVVPSILALHPTVRTVVTLHEFSIFRSYRSPWFLPFRFADALVFTNEVERGAFEKRFGRRKRNTAVIPIGSNIPAGRPSERDARSVVHFGLLMPGKGIERFFELAALLKSDDFRLFLIGSAPAGAETYRRWIEAECRRLDIRLHIDRSERDVADLLQTMRFAYLPFPDGASEKRGSLLAVLETGCRPSPPTAARRPTGSPTAPSKRPRRQPRRR